MLRDESALSSALWVIEILVALTPAAVLLGVAAISYAILLTILPKLLQNPVRGAVATLIESSIMVIGGMLGFISLMLASDARRLRRKFRIRFIAILFAMAGISAEVTYVHAEGVHRILASPFEIWVLLGPLVVGAHCTLRALRSSSTEHARDLPEGVLPS